MTEDEDKNFIFKIEVNGKPKWVERNYLVPNYMLDLINFYEAAICFQSWWLIGSDVLKIF